MTGISAPYQPPTHPNIEVVTDGQTIQQSVAVIMQFLNTKFK
jgi:adenylylsulfate kinase-like enzyme